MSKRDNLEEISSNMLDNLKNDGIEPKLDNIGIEKKIKDIWSKPSIIDDVGDYLKSAPTVEDLEKEVKKIAQTAAEALTKAELAYSKSMGLQKRTMKILSEVTDIYEKTKNLEEKVSASQERLESIKSVVGLMNGLVIGGFIMMVVAFIGWVIQDIQFRHSITDEWNQKIIQNENIISNFSNIILKEELVDKIYVDGKIESEINKAMIDFYKEQAKNKTILTGIKME